MNQYDIDSKIALRHYKRVLCAIFDLDECSLHTSG